MDILKDIKEILIRNKDKEHFLTINVSWDGVTAYLEYDPEKNFEEKCIIPIKYETASDSVYIPDDEYKEKFNPNEGGLELQEIVLIKEIMEYLASHSDEINKLCCGYDWEDREVDNGEEPI